MKQIGLLFLVLVLCACKTIKIDPPAPEFKSIEESSAAASSILFIETELALKPYLREADLALDNKFSGGEKQCEGISYQYHFEREPLAFEMRGSEIKCLIDGKFDLSLSYCPKCQDLFGEEKCLIPKIPASCGIGEPKRKVHISYKSKIGITEDFRLKSHTKLQEFALLDPCEITVFKYNATPTIEKEVKSSLIQLENEIDKQLAAAPLRTTIKEVWAALQEPIAVAPYGYFYLRPNGIGIADLQLKNEGQRAIFTTQLSAQPLFSTNAIEIPEVNLPKNAVQQTKSSVSTLLLRTISSYDSINEILLRDFDTQQIQINAKKQINIDRVQLLGPQGERLVLQIAFSGTKKGNLYLVVQPYIDSSAHLKIKDIEFEVHTKSVLLHSAKWLLDAKIKELLQNKIDIDLGPLLNETKNAIEKQINTEITKGVWLSGNLDELSVQNVLLTSSHLVVDLRLTGRLKLKIE